LVGAVLGGVAGTPEPTYAVDPASGKMTSTPAVPLTTAQKIKRIAMNALVGLSAPSPGPQKSGLASALTGFGAGAGAVGAKQDAQTAAAKAQAQQDFEQQQQTTLRKAELARGNALLYSTYKHLHDEDIDKNEEYKVNKDIAQAFDDEKFPVRRMTGPQLMQEFHESPQQLLSEGRILLTGEKASYHPDTGEPFIDPQTQQPIYERQYAVVDGMHDGKITLPQSFVDYAKKYLPYSDTKVPGYENLSEGTEVDAKTFYRLHNATLEGVKSVLQGWAKPDAVETKDGLYQKNTINGEVRPATQDQTDAYQKRKLDREKEEQAIKTSKAEAEKYSADADKARADAKKARTAEVGNTDAFGNTSPLDTKEFDKRYDAFNKSKQYTNLQVLQGSYQQFQQAVSDINAGKDLTGAASVVGLFNAIGISATPLQGKGFRINENTINEHVDARGLDQAAYQKLLALKSGAVITPKQLKDYASIAAGVYRDSYINTANEEKRQLGYVDVLPLGNNEPIDPMTAQLYLKIAGNDPAKARAAAAKNGWVIPPSK
jgi:hypothetical protein